MKPTVLGIYYYEGLFYLSFVNQKFEFISETSTNLLPYKKQFEHLTWASVIGYSLCMHVEITFIHYLHKSKAWWRDYLAGHGYDVIYFDLFYKGFNGKFHSWLVYWVPTEHFEIYQQDRNVSLKIVDIDIFCLWNYLNYFYPSERIREVVCFNHKICGRGTNVWKINDCSDVQLQERFEINSPLIMSKAIALRGLLHAI